MMTKQELYDSLVKAALDGTFPSVDSEGHCVYRSEDGSKRCAVGVFVPSDAPFKPEENKIVSAQSNEFLKWFHEATGLTECQAMDLQNCHDEVAEIHAHHQALVKNNNDFKTDFIARLNNLDFFADVNKYQA